MRTAGLLIATVLSASPLACGAGTRAELTYGGELQACTQASSTRRDSIDCEDRVRAKWGRPPRETDAGGDQ